MSRRTPYFFLMMPPLATLLTGIRHYAADFAIIDASRLLRYHYAITNTPFSMLLMMMPLADAAISMIIFIFIIAYADTPIDDTMLDYAARHFADADTLPPIFR